MFKKLLNELRHINLSDSNLYPKPVYLIPCNWVKKFDTFIMKND